MEETVAASRMTIGTVTNVRVWTRRLSTRMLSARKTAPCISGKAMENATTQIMSVVATGTVETAVDTSTVLQRAIDVARCSIKFVAGLVLRFSATKPMAGVA